MRTQEEWVRLTNTRVPWRERYAAIEAEVREVLNTLSPVATMVSSVLVPRMVGDLRGPEAGRIISRVYKTLDVLAEHGLADCWVAGPPRLLYGKTARVRLWHKPPPTAASKGNAEYASWFPAAPKP